MSKPQLLSRSSLEEGSVKSQKVALTVIKSSMRTSPEAFSLLDPQSSAHGKHSASIYESSENQRINE